MKLPTPKIIWDRVYIQWDPKFECTEYVTVTDRDWKLIWRAITDFYDLYGKSIM